ncbi:hypothetical protein HaLaN_25831, partial [Haematococcus lacustris]
VFGQDGLSTCVRGAEVFRARQFQCLRPWCVPGKKVSMQSVLTVQELWEVIEERLDLAEEDDEKKSKALERESVLQYVSRAEGLAAKVELTGAPFPDVVAFVLRGLPAEYKPVVEQVKFMEKPTVQSALPHLLRCEAELSKQAEFGIGGS